MGSSTFYTPLVYRRGARDTLPFCLRVNGSRSYGRFFLGHGGRRVNRIVSVDYLHLLPKVSFLRWCHPRHGSNI